MGGNQSKRRVVVEDTGGDEVVTVTEAVVRRLKGLPEEESSKKPDTPASTPTPSPSPTTVKQEVPAMEPQPFYRTKEDERYSAMLKQEAEDFYAQKLRDLQERNAKLQKQTNEQFAIAVQEVESKFVKVTASPVCQDLQEKVLQCYRTNQSELLNCSPLVNAFTTCVDRARMAASPSSSRLQGIS